MNDNSYQVLSVGPREMIIDSSALESFKSCPFSYKLRHIDHWAPIKNSVHLIAGGCFASALERARKMFLEGAEKEDYQSEALRTLILRFQEEDPEGLTNDSPKNWLKMAFALGVYFRDFPFEDDGVIEGVEMNFAVPLTDSIIYIGKLDMLQRSKAGILFGVDEKTTSRLGPGWASSWDLWSQFIGYCWAFQEQGINLQGFKVRGIGIHRTEIVTLQTLTVQPPFAISQWHSSTLFYLEMLEKCKEKDFWPQELGGACSKYSGCSFQSICKSPAHLHKDLLKTHYIQRPWIHQSPSSQKIES